MFGPADSKQKMKMVQYPDNLNVKGILRVDVY